MRQSVRFFSSFLKVLGVVSFIGLDLVRANPMGEQVVAGAASFQRDGGALTVTQDTQRAVINWNSFSIGAGEITRFIQPNSSAAVLNRVMTANNPSQIYGTLQANGQVYLINPAGVFVGPGGLVDTASFVASTRDVATEDFMKGGDLRFSGSSDAAILNQGKIEARQGDVFLIARQVSNEGQILASDGTVGMVSGTEISLQALGPHNYKVRLMDVADGSAVRRAADGIAEVVNQGVIDAANAELEATGNYLSLAIRNTGTIRATGVRPNADGSVTLTAGQGDLVNQGVVAALQKNVEGRTTGGEVTLAAKNVTLDPGSIVTAAGEAEGGKVAIDAKDTILASGKIEVGSEKGKGGDIVMTGERVGLVKAVVDASGATGGGEILVGGDYLGSNPNVRNAKATVMTSDSVIRANATEKGDGGRVILWSDEYTGFYGEIFARGGLQGGDGGFVETSSKFNLQAWGQADVVSPAGKSGTWLLDPYDVYIVETSAGLDPAIYSAVPGTRPITDLFTANVANAQISVSRILFALNDGQDVIIRTGPQPTDGLSPSAPGASPSTQPFTTRPGGGSGNIVVTVPIQAEVGSTGSLTIENLWVIRQLEGTPDTENPAFNKAGSIIINDNCPITVGGSLTLTAGAHLGSMSTSTLRARLTTDGEGGDVIIGSNSPIYAANGLVTITGGRSVATGSGGVGGDIVINSSIYAGRGINISGGDADRGWNWNNFVSISDDFVATTPAPANNVTVYDLNPIGGYSGTFRQFPAGSYLVQGIQSLGTTTAPPPAPPPVTPVPPVYTQLGQRNGVVPGDVTIASGTVFYLGQNSVSRIRAGNAGNNGNTAAGDLTIGNSILALGNNVSLVLASGSGVLPGSLTVSAPLGSAQSGTTFSYRNNNFSPNSTDYNSTALKKVTLQSGNLITIGATVRAETAEIMNVLPQNSLWLNHNGYEGTFACRVSPGSLNNLIGVSLGGTVNLTLGTTPNNYFSDEVDPLTLLPGNLNISNFGDISFSEAGSIDFQFSRINVVGKGSAVSFDNTPTASGGYAISLPSGGAISFNTQGEIFSNYQNSQIPNIAAIKIPNGTVDFVNVAAPGNNPSQGPQTGLLILDVANIQGAAVMGPSFIQTIGNVSLGNLTTVVGRAAQSPVVVTSATGRTQSILSLPPVLGVPNNPGDFSLASLGAVTISGNVLIQGGARDLNIAATAGVSHQTGDIAVRNINWGPNTSVFGSGFATTGGISQTGGKIDVGGTSIFNGSSGISLTRIENNFVGAVTLLSAAAGVAAVSILDEDALTLAAPTLGANTGIRAVAGTTLTLPSTAISTGSGSIYFESQAGSLATTANLTTTSGAITLIGSGGGSSLGVDHAVATSSGIITLRSTGTGGISLQDGSAVTASDSASSLAMIATAGGISQVAGSTLSVQGTTSIDTSGTGAGTTIALEQPGNNFVGAVSLTTSANQSISIRDANILNLGAVNMGTALTPGNGTLTLRVGSALTQSGVINTGTGGVFVGATASGTDISLASFANAIRASVISFINDGVSLPTNVRDYGIWTTFASADADAGVAGLTNLRNLSVIYDNAGIILPSIDLDGTGADVGNLLLSSGHATGVGQTVLSTWIVEGTTQISTTLPGAGINLPRLSNDFKGGVSLTTAANGNIVIRDANSIQFGAGSLPGITMGTSLSPGGGALTVTVGGVASGPVSISQTSGTGTVSTGTGGVNFVLLNTADIQLAGAANSIRAATITFTGAAANLRDYQIRTDFNLAAANAGLPLITPANLRNLTVIYDSARIELPALTLDGNGAEVGNLVLSSGNIAGVTQTGAWVVPGTSQITTTLANAPIQIDNASNNFDSSNSGNAVTLTAGAGGNISIRDIDALILGQVTMGVSGAPGSGTLRVEAGGTIAQFGTTIINTGTGNVDITTGGGSAITLANQNDFRGIVVLNGAATQITDINSLVLGAGLSTTSLAATSTGALNLGSGSVGALTAASNGGAISQTGGLTMGTSSFNAGTGSVTMTAGLGGAAQNIYGGAISLNAGAADFYMASGATGVSRLAQAAGSTTVAGTFTLRSPFGTTFNLANGLGGFELTAAQLANMSVGVLAVRASGVSDLLVGAFNPTAIGGLALFSQRNITASSSVVVPGAFTFDSGADATFGGGISAQTLDFTSTGAMAFGDTVTASGNFIFRSSDTATFNDRVSAGSLSFTSTGAVDFNAVNAIQNLGTFSVAAAAPLNFQNNQSLNLTGAGNIAGRLSMEVAGYFSNNTGQENPLSGVAGGSVIKSLSLFGPSLSNLYGLAGFSYRYDGVMPTTGNVMSYAVSPLVFTIPSGVTIAGVNLGGLPAAGQQLNTFETGSNDLNWMVSDFASFNLPQTPRAVLQYTLYPRRVETETRTLPSAELSSLQSELGRPPTVEEVQAREVARRDAQRVRQGAILERSSFDVQEESPAGSFEEAKEGQIPAEGNVPQADRRLVPEDKTAGSPSLDGLAGPQARKDPKSNPGSGETTRPQRSTRAYAEAVPAGPDLPVVAQR